MSKLVLTNCRVFAGGADVSGDTNEATVQAKVEQKDVTNYLSAGFKESIGGLGQASLDVKGYWEAGNPGLVDDASWAQLGAQGGYTLCPAGAAAGAVGYFTNAVEMSYMLGGKVGDVAPFALQAQSTWPLVRGTVACPPTAITATGSGAVYNLGAVAQGQYLYADLHVISVAGTTPSATFSVASSASAGFGSETTRLTFSAATAVGGQIARVAGPITDAYWRVEYAVSGTSPSFLAVVTVGIR